MPASGAPPRPDVAVRRSDTCTSTIFARISSRRTRRRQLLAQVAFFGSSCNFGTSRLHETDMGPAYSYDKAGWRINLGDEMFPGRVHFPPKGPKTRVTKRLYDFAACATADGVGGCNRGGGGHHPGFLPPRGPGRNLFVDLVPSSIISFSGRAARAASAARRHEIFLRSTLSRGL